MGGERLGGAWEGKLGRVKMGGQIAVSLPPPTSHLPLLPITYHPRPITPLPRIGHCLFGGKLRSGTHHITHGGSQTYHPGGSGVYQRVSSRAQNRIMGGKVGGG